VQLAIEMACAGAGGGVFIECVACLFGSSIGVWDWMM
jgi:hypothetical protein